MAHGGYREGSGRSKHGHYKGIYCGSTYELCWVIYNLDHGINFTRFPTMLENDGIKYFPDFLLEDGKTIVEIKGYEKQESVDKKTAVAESNGYNVIVLRKDDLVDIFKYVETIYNTKKFHILYDNYKPSYTYICTNCTDSFTTDVLRKKEQKFCNRRCAGLYRKEHKSSADAETSNYKRALTKEQALEIFNSKESLQKLADKFSITNNAAWFIKQQRTYKWIHL